jgi:hypothetical protein
LTAAGEGLYRCSTLCGYVHMQRNPRIGLTVYFLHLDMVGSLCLEESYSIHSRMFPRAFSTLKNLRMLSEKGAHETGLRETHAFRQNKTVAASMTF